MSHHNRPLVERAGRAAFWNTIFFPLKILIGFASSIIVVRLLRADFSLYIIATSLLTTLGMLSDLGIERAMQRLYPEIEMRYGRRGVVRFLLWITLVKGGALLVFIAALAIAPGYWIDLFHLGPNGGWLLLFVGLLLVLGAASDVSIQFIYTHFRQKATNALEVLAAVVNPTLTATFVLLGWGPVGALLALLITTVLSVSISLTFSWRLLSALPEEPHPKAGDIRRPTSRSLRARFISIAGLDYLINWTTYLYDLAFVAIIIQLVIAAPPEAKLEVGLIGLAFKFTRQFLRALVVPLTGVQTPLFARLYAEGRIDGLRTAYATITKFLILALLPACVGLIVLSRNLLQVFYGQVGLDAVVNPLTIHEIVACTVLLAIGLFVEAMIGVALNVLMVFEKYMAVAVTRLFALVSVPLMLILIPQYGALGGAIAVAMAALLSRLAALAYGILTLKLPFPSTFFVRVGMASIVMGLALLPILAYFPATLLPTLAMLLVGAGVFFVTFKFLGGMDQADKERFRALKVPFVEVALKFL